jgi:hypothetical protein
MLNIPSVLIHVHLDIIDLFLCRRPEFETLPSLHKLNKAKMVALGTRFFRAGLFCWTAACDAGPYGKGYPRTPYGFPQARHA